MNDKALHLLLKKLDINISILDVKRLHSYLIYLEGKSETSNLDMSAHEQKGYLIYKSLNGL